MGANETAAALLLVPFIVIYPTVILKEEAHLERLFPDQFRPYKAKVPRFCTDSLRAAHRPTR